MTVLLLIRELAIGGAERQLVSFARELKTANVDVKVAVFYKGGVLEAALQEYDIPIIALDKSGRFDILLFAWNFIRMVSHIQPTIIYSFLTGPNLCALLARLRFPRQIILWGVRASARDAILRQNDWFVRFVFWMSRYLSRFSNLIIVNSSASKTLLEQFGVPSSKVIVISNGIDTSYFRPKTKSGLRFREIHDIGKDELLIGIVARVDPIKDHRTFISAAAVFHRSHPNTRFMIVGGGPPDHIEKLRTNPAAVQLAEKLIWTGEQHEIASVYNAIDLNTLTSRSEGLPNSILEAMACGTLCVSTDVGDIKKVIRNDKLLFQVGDVNGLVSAWNHALAIRSEEEMSADKIAQSIATNFSKEQMAKRTVSTFLSLTNKAKL